MKETKEERIKRLTAYYMSMAKVHDVEKVIAFLVEVIDSVLTPKIPR